MCASLENTVFCNLPCTYNSHRLHMPNIFSFPKTLKSKHPLVICHLRSWWRLDYFTVFLLGQLLNLRNCEHKRQAVCSTIFYSPLFLSFITVWLTNRNYMYLMVRRKWQPTPVSLPGESQGQRSLVGCHLWGRTESDTTEAT